MMGLGLRCSIARREREVQVRRQVRRDWLLATGVALTLLPCIAAAKRSPWDADRVAALATQLIEQTQRLEDTLRASVAAAEAATADPDREAGVGGRAVRTSLRHRAARRREACGSNGRDSSAQDQSGGQTRSRSPSSS